MTKRGGAHGFSLGAKHLTLYWGGRGYPGGYYSKYTDIAGGPPDGGPVCTPRGLYHLLRHVGDKEWGTPRASIHALIRAMGKRFDWTAAEVGSLLNHGTFSYHETNGAGGKRHFEFAWVDQ